MLHLDRPLADYLAYGRGPRPWRFTPGERGFVVPGRDLPAMVIWAALIISLVAFGFGTRLWGMVLVLPLLGHATWYAYRDIVEEA